MFTPLYIMSLNPIHSLVIATRAIRVIRVIRVIRSKLTSEIP